MNKEVLIDIGSQLGNLRMYPVFDVCHYLLTALQVRDDIQQHQAGTQNFTRRHPLSCWLSTMLLSFSGSILSNFLLGESPIKDFVHYQHLLLSTICWYFVFYSPFDIITRLLRFIPIRIVVGIAKEIQRTKKIFDGVHSTLAIYPDGYLIVVLIGAIKGCGGSIMSSIDRFIRGVWLPTQNEFLFPSFATKACFISSIIFLLEHLQLIHFERELIYICVASMFIYVRVITVFFKQYDPFMPFENFSSGLLFNSWSETISDAYRRATVSSPSTGTTNLSTPHQATVIPAALTPLTATTTMVSSKKEANNNDGQAKGLDVDTASTTWLLVSSALVWIMIPGIGLFYSGMTKRKSSLSLLWLSFMAMAVTSVQWFLIGYSLSFSTSGSRFIGDFAHIATINVLDGPALGTATVPDIGFYFFQLMFAATSTTIVTGAASERGRIWPMTIFIFIWCTLVYNFVSCWIWSPNGWAAVLGALDYAGGVPVHMTAGVSALAYCLVLGKRQPVTHIEQNRSHNINNIFIGTVLSWFGWFGFNGGSGLIIGSRAVLACVVTNLAACTGGFTWCMLDYFLSKPKYKFTLFGFCMGAMAGLVCITPGSGYVGAPASLVFGIGGSACVYFGRQIKILLKIDDAFDIFAQHGVGGFVGSLLTGIFAQKYIPALDQTTIPGGWLDGNWIQVPYQLALSSVGFVWSFGITLIIVLIMDRIPGLKLRTPIDGETNGIDYDQFNEFTHDYIEFQRDLYAVLPKPSNNLVTVTTVDNQNILHKQNDIKMVTIKSTPSSNNAWGLTEMN